MIFLLIILIVIILSLIILVLYNTSTQKSTQTAQSKDIFSSPDCPAFSPKCGGDLIFSCYNSTKDDCFSGRQLSSTITLPKYSDEYDFALYYVSAISDSAGGYYNVPSHQPIDLNISLYQNVSGADYQMCGTYDETLQNFDYEGASTTLAAGQYYWLCTGKSYYIGVNSGDNANISTSQFYVCMNYINQSMIGYPMNSITFGGCLPLTCPS